VASAEEFILKLNQQVSGPADAAMAALNKLESQIMREQSALGGLEGKLASASAKLAQMQQGFGGKVDIGSVQKAQEQIASLQGKIGEKSGGLDKLKAAMGDFNKVAPEAAAGADKAGGAFGAMGDAAINGEGAMGKMKGMLSALGPEGAAVAAVITTLVAIITSGAVALWGFAEAAVASAQKRDALVATFDALGAGAGAGEKTLAATKALAAALPFTTSQVNAWAKSLMAAGVQGAALESGIKAVAAATAIMGAEGGSAAEGLIKRFSEMAETGQKVTLDRRILAQMAAAGVSAQALADQLDVPVEKLGKMSLAADKLGTAMEKALSVKGGPALEALGLTWDSIKAKLDEGLGSVFAGMSDAVKPFMEAIKSLFGEFNKGSTTMTTAGDMMKAVLTQVFAAATVVVNFLHKGFLQVEIAAFKVATAMMPIISVLIAISKNETMMHGFVLVFKAIGVVILAVVGFALMFAASIGFFVGIFAAISGAVVGMVSTIVGALAWCVGDAARATGEIVDSLSGWVTAAYDAAANFVSGIVSGISNGVGAVVGAVKALASSAMSAFTGFFKIHSPSQLMADTAIHIPGGAVEGIETGTGDVADAMQDMGDAGMGGAAKGFGKGGAKKSGGGDTYNVNVQYSGTREDFQHFKTLLADALEEARGLAPRTA
jgi:hypothetical protein